MNVDFDVLQEHGRIVKTRTYEDVDKALRAYRELYESLSINKEVIFGREGESFDFKLGISISSPYIITVQIYLG